MKENTRENLYNNLSSVDIEEKDINLIIKEIEAAEFCAVYIVQNCATHQISWKVITDAPLDEVVTKLFRDLVDNLDIEAKLLIYKLSNEERVYKVPVVGLNTCACWAQYLCGRFKMEG